MTMMIFRWYLLIVNIIAFFLYGLDKWKAIHHKWRVSEHTLLFLAVVGGSVGAWVGMQVYKHKTQKMKFRLGIPIIFLVQAFAIIAYKVLLKF